jgi:hypothetical protein
MRALPSRTDSLDYVAQFSEIEATKLRSGSVPKSKDDRWFIFVEDDWLYFCQTRSGACIFGLRLDRIGSGVKIGRSWVNRNPDEYRQRSLEVDRAVVDGLIRHLLL